MSKDIKPAPFRSSEEGPAYYKAKKNDLIRSDEIIFFIRVYIDQMSVRHAQQGLILNMKCKHRSSEAYRSC
jgi:hypothetical protein